MKKDSKVNGDDRTSAATPSSAVSGGEVRVGGSAVAWRDHRALRCRRDAGCRFEASAREAREEAG